ncbi:hypothetical protein PAHAL_1G323200 [Panicum hallii]|uniref:Uncharacterized protein n=1 Tax=Panicum hallii TaxID=206008 RepID=A0A2T8KX04_9POAL|nr:hypothetical protein PAHAL_1G323200 [Panicum hallii]
MGRAVLIRRGPSPCEARAYKGRARQKGGPIFCRSPGAFHAGEEEIRRKKEVVSLCGRNGIVVGGPGPTRIDPTSPPTPTPLPGAAARLAPRATRYAGRRDACRGPKRRRRTDRQACAGPGQGPGLRGCFRLLSLAPRLHGFFFFEKNRGYMVGRHRSRKNPWSHPHCARVRPPKSHPVLFRATC